MVAGVNEPQRRGAAEGNDNGVNNPVQRGSNKSTVTVTILPSGLGGTF